MKCGTIPNRSKAKSRRRDKVTYDLPHFNCFELASIKTEILISSSENTFYLFFVKPQNRMGDDRSL